MKAELGFTQYNKLLNSVPDQEFVTSCEVADGYLIFEMLVIDKNISLIKHEVPLDQLLIENTNECKSLVIESNGKQVVINDETINARNLYVLTKTFDLNNLIDRDVIYLSYKLKLSFEEISAIYNYINNIFNEGSNKISGLVDIAVRSGIEALGMNLVTIEDTKRYLKLVDHKKFYYTLATLDNIILSVLIKCICLAENNDYTFINTEIINPVKKLASYIMFEIASTEKDSITFLNRSSMTLSSIIKLLYLLNEDFFVMDMIDKLSNVYKNALTTIYQKDENLLLTCMGDIKEVLLHYLSKSNNKNSD